MTRSRSFRPVVSAALAAALVLGLLPQAEAQTTRFKPRTVVKFMSGEGCLSSDCQSKVEFVAEEFIHLDGVTEGMIAVNYLVGYDIVQSIVCKGKAYTGLMQIRPQQKTSSLDVTLNPASPGCVSTGQTGPVSIAVVGQSSGQYVSSAQGTRSVTFGSFSSRQSFAEDAWESIFNGTIGGVGLRLDGFTQAQRFVETKARP